MLLENGKPSEIEKSAGCVKLVRQKGKLKNYVLDLLKYPFAILLFNVSLFLFLRTKMNDGSLQLVLREINPKFY